MNVFSMAALALAIPGCALIVGVGDRLEAATPGAGVWKSVARIHRMPKKPLSGTLIIDSEGVEFRSAKLSRRWSFLDIHTFDLSKRDFTLTTYENRQWHEPGERRFKFTLAEAIPPSVAAILQERVGRPSRNGAPDATDPAIAEIPARHPKRFGGSNGTLRLRDSGIDYVTSDGRDSRTWRWSDIQTIANPDPYSFRITAYCEISEFELKQPLSRELFDELWTRLYANDLNLSVGRPGDRQ